jgi:hypothetical protein
LYVPLSDHYSLAHILHLQLYAALIIIGPWIIALVYDLLLYLWRSIFYEIPIIGGRARGRAPPPPPSIADGVKGIPPIAAAVEEVVSSAAAATGSSSSRQGTSPEEMRARTGNRQPDSKAPSAIENG